MIESVRDFTYKISQHLVIDFFVSVDLLFFDHLFDLDDRLRVFFPGSVIDSGFELPVATSGIALEEIWLVLKEVSFHLRSYLSLNFLS